MSAAGETRLHSSVPFLLGSVALLSMAFFLDRNPSAAFVSLLGATVIWGAGGVVYSLPATFLSVRVGFSAHLPCLSSAHAAQSSARHHGRLKCGDLGAKAAILRLLSRTLVCTAASFACSGGWACWFDSVIQKGG